MRRSKEKDEHQVKDHKACEIFKSKHKTVSPSESEGEKKDPRKGDFNGRPHLERQKSKLK